MKEFYLTTTLRKKLQGQNISALARELKIPSTCIWDWIHGRRMPSLKNLHHVKKLADYLDLDFQALLLGPENEKDEGKDKIENENRVITRLLFEDEGREYQVNILRNNKKR